MKLKYIIAIGGVCSSLLIATNSKATETTIATESLLQPIGVLEEIVNVDNIPPMIERADAGQVAIDPVSANDLRYMSAIIWAEAGNQCKAGQQAVGIVVMNRIKSSLMPNTIYEVIAAPGQFTPFSNGSFAIGLIYYDMNQLSPQIIDAARYALNGNTYVYYNETLLDLDGYLYFSRWIYNHRLIIQDHMFK